MQSNWIGKSFGAEIDFKVQGSEHSLKVYTTRPDTVFGVDFMVVAPEHNLIESITPDTYKASQSAIWVETPQTGFERVLIKVP
jgi:leucyl-tRNA synthetase